MRGKYKSTQQRTDIRGTVHLISSHLGNTGTFVKIVSHRELLYRCHKISTIFHTFLFMQVNLSFTIH